MFSADFIFGSRDFKSSLNQLIFPFFPVPELLNNVTTRGRTSAATGYKQQKSISFSKIIVDGWFSVVDEVDNSLRAK